MSFSKQQRKIIHSKFNGKCAYCGSEIEIKDMQVDHIIPQRNFIPCVTNRYKIPFFLNHLTVNDLNHIDNLNPACRVCNKWKDTFDLEQFRFEISQQIIRLNKYSASYRLSKKYNLIQEIITPIQFYFEKQ